MNTREKGKRAVVAVMAAVGLLLGICATVRSVQTSAQLEAEVALLTEQMQEKDIKIAALKEQTADHLDAYLPGRLYVAVGRTLELYNAQVAFSGNRQGYSFNWVCDIGRNLERKFAVTGEDKDLGEHTLTLTIYNDRLEPVWERETVLEVVEDRIRENVHILNIGDSLSDSTPWYEEVTRLSDGRVTFVGTRGSKNAMHEGRSGFSICDYLTETDYPYAGEGVHDFYNPAADRFDFSYYKETTGVHPDVVQIFLGKNGMSLDSKPGIDWLKEMVDNIRETEPDIPIYLVQTIYMGDQNGIGRETDGKGNSALNGYYKTGEDEKVFLWTKAMEEAFGEMEQVYLIPAALTFDSAYNFRAGIEKVNARSSRTEAVLEEGMHPNEEGYLQIADGIFSVYCGTMR